MLNEFVRPRPNARLIRFLAPVNNILCLKGVPLLRDIPVLNSIIGFRGICNVRHLDFPKADQDRLAAVCGQGKITFLAPNHPEFFTDWMLDKYVTTLTCPNAANWATHGVVNGLGKLMQNFWLANNLIAQIPGNPDPSRAYSVEWAGKGHGVLLHPEGGVGWHSNFIAPLFPGAMEMAREALAENPDRKAYVAPVVWKLVFNGDVTGKLHKECAYVEGKLGIDRLAGNGRDGGKIELRVFHLYQTLLKRDEEKWSAPGKQSGAFRVRQLALIGHLREKLCSEIDGSYVAKEDELLLRGARRWMRENKDDPKRKEVRDLVETIARHESLDEYAFASETVTQEELAEHIKRVRRDYCKGSLKDTLNAFLPQAGGPRTAHIRVPEPFALHNKQDAQSGPPELRARMQKTLDEINQEVEAHGGFIRFDNPFRG